MKRAVLVAWWLLPIAFFFWLYANGLRVWFQQDDFAWLGQGLEIHNWRDLFSILFTPRAQGTIRPWSERLFFVVFFDRFGLDPRPYHAWVALTQTASILLLQSITWKLLRSRLASLLVPIVWLSGVALATPLAWLSSYNEVLCAFFVLLAFRCLLRAIDTGRRRWWVWQAVVFVLGFGALELNVVYPALAAAYCWFFARDHFRKTVWLFPVSAVYVIIHQAVAVKPDSGPYARHWDFSMLTTYVKYWGQALAGGMIAPPLRLPPRAWEAAAWGVGAVLTAFALWAWRRGNRIPAFGVVWFTVAITPVLSLRDHFTSYYLTIPTIGLAFIFGAFLSQDWRPRLLWKTLAILAIAANLAFSIPVNRLTTRWWRERGVRIRTLVQGIERAAELHPGKIILLTHMDAELYWAGLNDDPARLFGAPSVYLAPEEERAIVTNPEFGDISRYIASPGLVARAVSERLAVVYSYEPRALRNVTRRYAATMPAEWRALRPAVIEAGKPIFARDLGEGWYDSEGDWRWMKRRASLYLPGPGRAGQRLVLSGFRPPDAVADAVTLTAEVDGAPVGTARLEGPDPGFEVAFPLPEALTGRQEVTVTLELDRTKRSPADSRQRGLLFGRIGIR